MIDRLLDLLTCRRRRHEARFQAAVLTALAEQYDLRIIDGKKVAVQKPDYRRRAQ